MTEKQKVKLTKSQERTVLALVKERQQVEQQANKEIAEINQALTDLTQLYARELQMPLESVFKGGTDALFLVHEVPDEEAPAEPAPDEEGPAEEEDTPEE